MFVAKVVASEVNLGNKDRRSWRILSERGGGADDYEECRGNKKYMNTRDHGNSYKTERYFL